MGSDGVMPGLVRKLLIVAAVDGLILQPISQRSNASVKISYKTNTLVPTVRSSAEEEDSNGLEVHGVIGFLTVSSSSYILAILRRKQVAQLWEHPVYSISDVAIIPISSQADAQSAIQLARQSTFQGASSNHTQVDEGHSDAENDALVGLEDTWLDRHVASLGQQPLAQHGRRPSVAEEVIGKKGVYGRFAEKWFSTHGWLRGSRRNMGMSGESLTSSSSSMSTPDKLSDKASETSTKLSMEKETDQRSGSTSFSNTAPPNFIPKLLQTTKLLLASGTFFYSYGIDLTHRLSNQFSQSSNLALYKQADPAYFWNKHLAEPLISQGCDDLVIPLLQGFVGQREFSVGTVLSSRQNDKDAILAPKEKVVDSPDDKTSELNQDTLESQRLLLTLISRRSVKRSGLRYLRRGIDEEGNTANAVETEQILSTPTWQSDKAVQSFVQVRGSIPLFFTQLPYTFKPPAALYGSPDANRAAFKKHFTDLVSRYGDVEAVSLVDRQGVETTIGDAYDKGVKEYNEDLSDSNKKIGFEWFNFHQVCRGMRFENVSVLVDSMADFLGNHGWTSLLYGDAATPSSPSSLSKQTGVIRTNCMDCLDRTNVVQSAFAQFMLEKQLENAGHPINLNDDPSTTWFNTLWADNGDAISRSYAGTSALKGDYTRTRRRNVYGMLTDFSLTLTRYYLNLFNDFFAQAAIDYLLGNVTEQVFTEFQTNMTSVDPAIDLRKARDGAIQLATTTIVNEQEHLLFGWALAVPAVPNSLRTLPFEEALLLLTDRAVYSVRYDWDTEKVRSFERVSLNSIQSLQRGEYISETLAETQTDTNTNVGLVIRYKTGKGRPSLVRVNTRTLITTAMAVPETNEGSRSKDDVGERTSEIHLLAFKTLPQGSAIVRSTSITPNMSEKELVAVICNEILKATEAIKVDTPADENRSPSVYDKPIISLVEAKRGTSIVDYVGYNLKKLVWG